MTQDIFLGSSESRQIFVPHKDRQYHTHIIGAPGQGKSKFMEHLIRADIMAGHGLCVIDPHGSLYANLVSWLAAVRLLDSPKMLLFEPDESKPVTFGFNPLNFTGLRPGEVADAIDRTMRAFGAVWREEESTGKPTIRDTLPLIFRTLWEHGLTLVEGKLLCYKNPLQTYLTRTVSDPETRRDWEYYNTTLSESEYAATFLGARNRLQLFVQHPLIRAMIGQTEQVLDFKACMDKGAVVLVNLGKLQSEENKRIMGMLMVNDIHSKGLLRDATDDLYTTGGGRPFFLYIDECYYCLNEDIERISIGLRKFGVWMTLAHHTLAQLRKAGESVYSAVMMIPNKVVFGGLEEEDAEKLVLKLFLGQFNFEDPVRILDKPTVVGYQKRALHSYSQSHGHTTGGSETLGETSSADDELVSQIVSEMQSDTETETESETHSETFVPDLEDLPTAVKSPQQLIFEAMITLIHQRTQHAVVRRYRRKSVHVRTPWVQNIPITTRYIEDRKQAAFKRSAPALPADTAQKTIADRRDQLELKAREAIRQLEPATFLE